MTTTWASRMAEVAKDATGQAQLRPEDVHALGGFRFSPPPSIPSRTSGESAEPTPTKPVRRTTGFSGEDGFTPGTLRSKRAPKSVPRSLSSGEDGRGALFLEVLRRSLGKAADRPGHTAPSPGEIFGTLEGGEEPSNPAERRRLWQREGSACPGIPEECGDTLAAASGRSLFLGEGESGVGERAAGVVCSQIQSNGQVSREPDHEQYGSSLRRALSGSFTFSDPATRFSVWSSGHSGPRESSAGRVLEASPVCLLLPGSAVVRGSKRVDAEPVECTLPGSHSVTGSLSYIGDVQSVLPAAASGPGAGAVQGLKTMKGHTLKEVVGKLRLAGGNKQSPRERVKADVTERRPNMDGGGAQLSPGLKARVSSIFQRRRACGSALGPQKVNPGTASSSLAIEASGADTSVPTVHHSAVVPTAPIMVRQALAPSVSVVTSDVDPDSSLEGGEALVDGAVAVAVIPTHAGAPPSVVVSTLPGKGSGPQASAAPTSVDSSKELDSQVAAPRAAPEQESASLSSRGSAGSSGGSLKGEGAERKDSGGDGTDWKTRWGRVLGEVQDVLLGVLVLVALCSLFLGKISAIAATLCVGLLASRVMPPRSPSRGVKGDHGSMERAESSMRFFEGNSSSPCPEKSTESAGRVSAVDAGAVRRQQQIAHIMQYSRTTDPKARSVLEGLLARPTRTKGRR